MDTFFKTKSKVEKPEKALFRPKRALFDFLSCVHSHIKPDTSKYCIGDLRTFHQDKTQDWSEILFR